MRHLASVFAFVLGCGGAQPQPQPQSQPHAHDHSHGMPHRFDDADRWAKVFDDPERDAWQQPDKVIAALELAPTMKVADVGAGTGYFAMRLAKVAAEVVATDVEPDMIRYMSERAGREGLTNVRAVLTPPDDPQLPPVDRILVVDVWHHLGDRVAYAKKLAGSLAPAGFVAVVDFKLDAKLGPPRKMRLPPEAIIDDLRAAGLDAKLATVELPEQYIVIARRR
jgi:SAM-dependent methyltransferase